nr:hypothetical protein [uncultured Campylobacter sp.]
MQEINLSWQKEALVKRQSARTRLAFLVVAVLILAVEIYIAVCVNGGFGDTTWVMFWWLSCFMRWLGLFLVCRF